MKSILTHFLLTLVVILGYCHSSQAQYYNYGQEPTKIKWLLIETDNYKVIFPKGQEHQGQHVAGLLEDNYLKSGNSLNHHHKKWDVVLHTNSATGLAYVAPTPSRSDWMTMQIPTANCMDRLTLFAVHETRHMVQQSKVEKESPTIFKILLGQQVAPIIIGAYLPFWFMEGDATSNETALGPTGSGRMPTFFMENKAQLVESDAFSFNKTYMGSYKDYTPDAYQMGYLMVAGARHKYQNPVWDEVVSNVAQKPLSITAFNKGIKNATGLSKYQLFDTLYTDFRENWKEENIKLKSTSQQVISKKGKYYSNYLYGTKLSNGKYFAGKWTLDDLNRLVVIDEEGNNKKVFTSGYPMLESVSALDSMVVWSENKPHIRWEYSDKTILRILNLNTNKLNELKAKKRYVAPSLSPDKSKILVVEVDENNHNFLKVLESQTGEELWSFNLPENDYFITPSWSKDGESIVSVLLKNNKQAIAKINISSKQLEILQPYKHQHIISPKLINDTLYFIGGYTGINNVYSMHTLTRKVQMETSVPFGVWNLSVVDHELIYSNYRSTGYELVSISMDSLLNKAVNIDSIQVSYPMAETLTKQEGGATKFRTDTSQYTVEKYSKLKHAFNFHSWGPFAIAPSDGMIYPGLSVFSQNVMGTNEFQTGYQYNPQDRKNAVFANVKYKGLFPIFEFNVEYGGKASQYKEIVNTDTLSRTYDWRQTTLDIDMYVPLNLSKGKWDNKIQPSIGYQGFYQNQITAPNVVMEEGYHQLVKAGIYMHKIIQSSRQDITPNWGLTLDVNCFKALNGTNDKNYMGSGESWLTLPGFAKNHGVKVYNGFQYKDKVRNPWNEVVRLARGYRTIANQQLYTTGADYVFPIAYPDYTLLKTIYFKRIKAALFYDQSWVSQTTIDYDTKTMINSELQSTGIELTTDLHFFQIAAPLDIGVRASYRSDNTVAFDFIFGASMAF